MRKILVLLLVATLVIPAVGCRQGRLFRGVWWRQECDPVIIDPCAPMMMAAPATCSPCAPAPTTVAPSTTVVPGPGAYTTPTP
ncbi:MAG: hypothetical protein NZ602_04315 [Thermoguttaceae bacterium]|nr:hypothetical protein [Thermoguttaceae bacterium]MDW8036660.1 hypothetical protein [Thermoguttaceae bacterium]